MFQVSARPLTDARLAGFAVEALIQEAELTPKPGLVDGRGSGSHGDMNLDLMLASARALRPAFGELARLGRDSLGDGEMRVRLAAAGRDGEAAMFAVTGGVNTHRGAIWALGLAVAASAAQNNDCEDARADFRGNLPDTRVFLEDARAGFQRNLPDVRGSFEDAREGFRGSLPDVRVSSEDAREGFGGDPGAARAGFGGDPAPGVLARVAAIASHPDTSNAGSQTRGSAVRARYGVPGAVGQARAGFPAARLALDTLREHRAAGASAENARLDALMASIAVLDDTCLLGRGGPGALAGAQLRAGAVLAAGGAETARGRRRMNEFDRWTTEHRLSPGGSADMLALALFLDRLPEMEN